MKDSTFALRAVNTFKDNYLLDYINTEELGVRDIADIDERVLEKEIIHNTSIQLTSKQPPLFFFGMGFFLHRKCEPFPKVDTAEQDNGYFRAETGERPFIAGSLRLEEKKKQVDNQRNPDLRLYGVLAPTVESLNPQVLLYRLEEKLDLPPLFV